MKMVKQAITFRFGPVDQDSGAKHLRPGVLTELVNARQTTKNDYRKRRGYSRTAFSGDSGSFTGPPDSGVYTNTRLVRDAAGVNWAYDSASATWRNMGTVVRPFPTTETALTPDGLSTPQLVFDGTNDWIFARRTNGYAYTVRNRATGRVIQQQTRVTATSIYKLVAISNGTAVYLFWVAGGTTVNLHKYVIATPTVAATTHTYQTDGSAAFRDIDVDTVGSEIFVIACSGVGTGGYRHVHSYLDTSTNAAKASPAAVTTTGGSGGASVKAACCGVSAFGSGYFSVWRQNGTGMDLALVSYNTTTLAITSTVVLATVAGGAGLAGDYIPRFNSAGYVSGSDQIVLAGSESAEGDLPEAAYITRYTRSGGSTTSAVLGRSCWIATKPFQVDSAWYVVTGTTQSGQNAYHVRLTAASTGRVVGQLERGLAPTAYNDAGGQPGDETIPFGIGVYAPSVSGSTVYFANISDFNVVRTKLDFAASYAPAVALGPKMLVPGPIPYGFGIADAPRELTPLMAPEGIVGTNTGSTRFVQAVYRITDADGTFVRSAPCTPHGLGAAANATLTVKTLRHVLVDDQSNVQIEVYLTPSGSTTPQLRYVRQNDPSVDTISLTVNINAADETSYYDSVDPESIYTSGNALSAVPPPPCRGLCVWRNRVFAYATPQRGRFFVSMELKQSEGPRFNNVLSTQWAETTSDIVRMEPIDWSNCAIMSSSHVGFIFGDGPADNGQGNYTVQLVQGAKPLKNARAAVTGPAGLYYQANDNRFYVVAGTTVQDLSVGSASYTSPVSAAAHDPAEHEVQFWLEDAKMLVLDTSRPTEEQPFGQWHMWQSDALLRGYVAAVVGGVPEWMETTGARRAYQAAFTDTNAAGAEVSYDMRLTSGELAIFDLGHEFRVDGANVHGDFVASHTLSVALTFDSGATSATTHTSTRSITAAPFQTMVRPRYGHRVQSVKFTLTVSGSTEGAVFSGMTIIAQDRGITKFPNTAQRAVDTV